MGINHDLKASLVNVLVVCQERTILPRLRGAIMGALKVMKHVIEGEDVTQLVLDFADAFKTLPVRPRLQAPCLWMVIQDSSHTYASSLAS